MTSHQSSSSDLLMQEAQGQGGTEQVTNYNQINAGRVVFDAPAITAQIGSKDSALQLAHQPGMGWIGQLSNDPALQGTVNWTSLQDASSHWQYQQQGLSPAAAALVTVAVAYFTAGMGAEFAAAQGFTTLTPAGTIALTGTGTVVAGAASAAIAALGSRAVIAFAAHPGDLGAVLQDLGSSDSVKGLVAAILTGGALGALNLNALGQATVGGGAQSFPAQLAQNVQAGLARAVINTAVFGGSLEDNIKAGLLTSLIDTAAAQTAFAIGSNITPGSAANLLAHALAGCAAGQLRSSSGCAPGALGAGIGEIAAGLYDPNAQNAQRDTVQFASMMGALAAVLAGADAAGVNLASQSAGNAAANNWLATQQKALMDKEMAQATFFLGKVKVLGKWVVISGDQDRLTGFGIGKGLAEGGWGDLKGISEFLVDPVKGLTGLRAMVNNPELRQQIGDVAFQALDAKIAGIQNAVLVGGDQNAEQLGIDLGNVFWQVGSLAAGVGGIAETGTALAKLGIKAGDAGLAAMQMAVNLLKADAAGLGGLVDLAETGIKWGGGIEKQGIPFEEFVQAKLPPGTLDLNTIKTTFSTFDHFTADGIAISDKTLNTLAKTYSEKPASITSTLNGYIDRMINFPGDGKGIFELTNEKIVSKQMQLAIPASTSVEQMAAISKSILYAQSKGVEIVVTKVK